MKFTSSILLLAFCVGSSLRGADETDLGLWYRQPAKAWRESLFIGYCRLGGAVWGGVRQERIDLNEDTLWSGEPYENSNTNGLSSLPEIRRLLLAGKELDAQKIVESTMLRRHNENYLALGSLKLDFGLDVVVTNYARQLDLKTAIVRESFEADGVKYGRETFASHPAQTIVVRLSASEPGKIFFTASLYDQLERVVIPLFCQQWERFVDMMRHAIALNGSFFNTQRMVLQYVLKAYFE